MKTLLINPFARTITETEFNGSLDAMYDLLHCSIVEGVYCNDLGEALFDDGNILFVDEEGLLGNLSEQAFFIIDDKPIAGYAMTTNSDAEGNTIESTVTLEELKVKVEWATLVELRALYE